MRRLKIFSMLVVTLLLCLLTSCGTFEGFDDDNAIIKANSISTVMSSTSMTPTKYKFKCSKINGVEKVKDITVPSNPVFDINLTISEGRFKIVLIKDSKVYVICDANQDGRVSTNFPAGTYSLRLVGEDAKVDLEFLFNDYR